MKALLCIWQLLTLRSWWGCRNDGGINLPSTGWVTIEHLKNPSLILPDTVKVRMQLSSSGKFTSANTGLGFLSTAAQIVRKESPKTLYKGLGAVTTGIVPKMAIRFTSFETYKGLLADKETGTLTARATFLGK
jgi:hypothetical protein